MPNSPATRARLQGQSVAPRIFSRWQGVVTCIDAYSSNALDMALGDVNKIIQENVNAAYSANSQAVMRSLHLAAMDIDGKINDIIALCGTDELLALREVLEQQHSRLEEVQYGTSSGFILVRIGTSNAFRQAIEPQFTSAVREALYVSAEFESFAEAAERVLQNALAEQLTEIYQGYMDSVREAAAKLTNQDLGYGILCVIAERLAELLQNIPQSCDELTTQVYAMLGETNEQLTSELNNAKNIEITFATEEELRESLRDIFNEEYRVGFAGMVQPKLEERIEEYNAALEYLCREIAGYHVGMFGVRRRAEGLKSESCSQQRLTKEVRTCFERICVGFRFNEPELHASDDFEIIKGINDTIDIKCQSITEALNCYMEECAELICGFSGCERGVLNGQISAITKAVASELFSRLSTLKRNDRRGAAIVRLYLAEAELDESENAPLAGLKRALQNAYGKAADGISKKSLRHTKDSLLFEISTFEEIMHYSVSRLRQSEVGIVADYVALIDRQMQRIESLLAGYGITTIRPQPHDSFDGKEHEVLVAEVQEGFKKGEIIKPMNSGYKRGGVVLLRANVIAAK